VKTIDIRDQPILSFARTVHITANGIRYRLFRSAVTVVVVAVAVAFLMNILSESLVRRAVARRTGERIAELRSAAALAGRLAAPGTLEEILVRVARSAPGEPAYREAAGMGGLGDDEMRAYRQAARQAADSLAFFAELDYARRRALVHDAAGADIFDRLRDEAAWERFASALKTMRSVRLPTPVEEFAGFLKEWPATRERTMRVQRSHAKAVVRVAAALKGRTILEALADVEGAFGDAVREAGFVLDPVSAPRVAAQARAALDTRALEKSIAEPEMRKAVAGYLDLLPGDVSVRTLWRLLRDRETASWYLARLREQGSETGSGGTGILPVAPRTGWKPAPPMSVGRLVELANLEAETAALTHAERMGTVSGGLMGIGERMSWLVLASMLVCVVGISNAMLMSVAERFREIATLKCLGALDGFILLMFVLEACFLGIVGGILGAVLGSVIGLGRMFLAFGPLLFSALPGATLAAFMGASVVLGVILAAIASVYPSLKASRLAPMEAMRIQ